MSKSMQGVNFTKNKIDYFVVLLVVQLLIIKMAIFKKTGFGHLGLKLFSEIFKSSIL